MRCVQVWKEDVKGKDGESLPIYDIAFHPDGRRMVVAAGKVVLVYNTEDGKMVDNLKAHKDTVYTVSYSRDGQTFASGSADKQVVLWSNDELKGILKYGHSDLIQSLQYNPVSQLLLSCTTSEVGLWSPEQKSVMKTKVTSKCLCCSWTNDGQFFAVGHYNGTVTIWTKTAEKKNTITREGDAPIWTLSWNPSRDDHRDKLTVCDWNKKLSFYQLNGKQVGKDRKLDYDPTCVSYFPGGDFSVIAGSNSKASIYSKDGVMLSSVVQGESWIWCCRAKPGKEPYQLVVGRDDGTLSLHQLTLNTVHGLYKERYAYRERLTDVVVQHLLTNDKVTIKCRDMVKKIAVYRNRLAVQLPEKIVVYELSSGDDNDLKYTLKDKFVGSVDCSLLVVCSQHLVLCQERKLLCYTFKGDKEREWVMEAQIRYIRALGGPSGREGILVGLKNGQVFKIFIDNSFPISLIKLQLSIRCVDLSASRTKLAVVDENSTLLVYNLNNKELLYQEPNANSVSWNTQYEDMLCFSGNGMLSIKASNFPAHQRKQQGFVVGFSGSKIFCLHFFTMSAIDVPQSAPMVQYLERKLYNEAHSIACLMVTQEDWRVLGQEALEGMDFRVAKKAFARVKDLRFLELIHDIEERKSRGENDTQDFLADIFAYQGKFNEAGQLYKKCGKPEKAVELFMDLRQFEQAKEFAVKSETLDVKHLIAKEADWAKTTNDAQSACDMYLAAGEYLKAVELMGDNGWVEKILNLVHEVGKGETEILSSCAHHLRRLTQFSAAAEVYEKMGDTNSLITLYVETHQWDNAFEVVKVNPEFKGTVYMPYAAWLMENDRFDEAQEALKEAGQQTQAVFLLEQLAENAVHENRFSDGSYYYWLLAKTNLEAARRESEDPEGSSLIIADCTESFYRFMELADTYYAYTSIHAFVDQPFTALLPEALHNISRFLTHKITKQCPPGVSKVSVLFTLAKQSKQLGAYKLARHAFDKLQSLRIPPNLQETVDLASITIRAKPFQDKEDLLPICYRCSNTNPLLNNAGNFCVNCRQSFEFSFVSFEVLPVVEFVTYCFTDR
ncbi:intraflagellar transport protein 122 homolog isoform X2 [Halichondria panicea]|uniref:intraflagellar transport protein 122 homolog isoform X2 n=1 Tax=Halichondria panicea TaxID=6063 RepID=UPI00312BC65F